MAVLLTTAGLLLSLPLAHLSFTQNAGQNGRGRRAAEPAKPTPRLPDGRVNFGPPEGQLGLWLPDGRPRYAEIDVLNPLLVGPQGQGQYAGKVFPDHPKVSQVPFQPWARQLFEYRQYNLFEPHTRCKPSGGSRQFITPHGVEIVDMPELKRVFIFDVSGPHTWRTIYLDRDTHPKDLVPTYYGDSIGHWEGDSLVVDTIGFNEKFWMEREGSPHTEKLHLIERFTRTDFNTMKIEVTVDDPGAYTATWKTGFYLTWTPGREGFEYICQENNHASELMIGFEQSVDRSSRIVP